MFAYGGQSMFAYSFVLLLFCFIGSCFYLLQARVIVLDMHPTVMGESFEDVAPYNAAMNVCDKASQWQAWGKGGLLGREVVQQIGVCVFWRRLR